MKSAKRKVTRGSSMTFKAEEDRRENHPVAHGIGLIVAMLSGDLGCSAHEPSHHQSESRDEQEDLQAFELIAAM